MTVTPVNDAPVCPATSSLTAEDQSVMVTLTCTDVDSPDLVYGDASALHGKVTGSGPTRTYTPDRDFSGTDTISFTGSDGVAQPVPSTVTVTITSVNDAPVAAGDFLSARAGTRSPGRSWRTTPTPKATRSPPSSSPPPPTGR